jgi:hypothetical protein
MVLTDVLLTGLRAKVNDTYSTLFPTPEDRADLHLPKFGTESPLCCGLG